MGTESEIEPEVKIYPIEYVLIGILAGAVVFVLLSLASTFVRWEPLQFREQSVRVDVWTSPSAAEYGGRERLSRIVDAWEPWAKKQGCRTITIEVGSETYLDGLTLYLGPQDPTDRQLEQLCQQ